MPNLQRISSKFTEIPHIEIDFSTKNIEESVAPWFFFGCGGLPRRNREETPVSNNCSFLEILRILSVGSSNSFYETWLIRIEPLTFTYPLGGCMACAKYFDTPGSSFRTKLDFNSLHLSPTTIPWYVD